MSSKYAKKSFPNITLLDVDLAENRYMGMTLKEVYQIQGLDIRILSSNGNDCIIADLGFKKDRVNVAVVDNVVTHIYGKG